MSLPAMMRDVFENEMDKLTPMMKIYLEIKKEHDDCIIFYRLGDFYEMFFDDALEASKTLELTLTKKSCGLDERAPMCGVPYHAAETYINRLVKAGYKVCIVEQMEDPSQAKGLVRREVVRIVTPGTNINTTDGEDGRNNYILTLSYFGNQFGIATCDVSTGDFYVTSTETTSGVMDEINKFRPNEIICNHEIFMSGLDMETLKEHYAIPVFELDDLYFDEDSCIEILFSHFHVSSLIALGIDDNNAYLLSSGALMKYLYETQKNELSHISKLIPYTTSTFMMIDSSTRRNLEICETMREKQKRGSLFWVLDKTKTAMGARTLRSYIEQPLVDIDMIKARQDAVEDLSVNMIIREELREYLTPVYDLERLIGRVSYRSALPRDLVALKSSLAMLPYIKALLRDLNAGEFVSILDEFDTLDDIHDLIDCAISEEPPVGVREGGIIKSGYSEEVDRLRLAKTDGKSWLAKVEEEEKEKTGIKNLRIKYNKVFGYYVEVSNSFKDKVPEYYVRKQTLVNGERYTFDRLKELEETIVTAEDKLFSLEYNIFAQIREDIFESLSRIQKMAKNIAKLDVYASLSFVADREGYVKPTINNDGIIDIKDGRHPVVEKMMPSGMFIPNNTYLDMDSNRLAVITGPNMAGKSTYMRQTALICLMAQIGSFVPASSASICICDKIFTRVGASDDLASGQSTFMVEMNEVANILRNATNRSLLILDEIGRGTSTFDGLSIAWAVVEHIADKKLLGAKTLFATHYHELTELEGVISGVNNYCISVKDNGDDIIFLRKIVEGGADKSYGVQVAKLAGVPQSVIDRAGELLKQLTEADISAKAKEIALSGTTLKSLPENKFDDIESHQMTLFDTVDISEIIDEVENLNLNEMTPIDSMKYLYKLQNLLKNRF